MVNTPFAKAFDKCETGVLLHRLRQCGVGGKVGCWVAAFLDPAIKKQAVGVEGEGRLSSLASDTCDTRPIAILDQLRY